MQSLESPRNRNKYDKQESFSKQDPMNFDEEKEPL